MSVTVMPQYPPDLVLSPPSVFPPLLEGLPEYEQASRFVQAYLRTVGAELQLLEQARQELLLSWFPATADTTLVFWEQMLGLSVNPATLTVAQRQQTILAFMQAIKSQGEGFTWEMLMAALMGAPPGTGVWSYREHDPADGTSPAAYVIEILIANNGNTVQIGSFPGGFALAQEYLGGISPYSPEEQRVLVFARTITPAHLDITVGFLP